MRSKIFENTPKHMLKSVPLKGHCCTHVRLDVDKVLKLECYPREVAWGIEKTLYAISMLPSSRIFDVEYHTIRAPSRVGSFVAASRLHISKYASEIALTHVRP